MTQNSLRISLASCIAIISGCSSAPPTDKSIERGAVSGIPQHVGFYYSVNPDCSSNGLVKTQLKSPPTHGTVGFVNADGFTNFPANSSSFECNKKKSAGVAIEYTSAKNFVGADQFVVQGIGPNGKYMETAYEVKVLAPK
jgi:hypothetical protein